MPAFVDATCPKCQGSVGWFGDMKDRPACPGCGHRPPQAELDALDAELDRAEATLRERMLADDAPGRVNGGAELRRARMAAGLTLVDASAALGVPLVALSQAERGEVEFPAAAMAKAAEVYSNAEGR